MISLNIVKSFYTFDEIDFKFENIVGYEVGPFGCNDDAAYVAQHVGNPEGYSPETLPN